MRRSILTTCLCIAIWNAPALSARGEVASLQTLLSSITNVVALLDAHHIVIKPDEASRATVESIARSADPAARIFTSGEAKHRQEEQRGMDYSIGIRLSMTNGMPVIAEVVSNSPAATAGLRAGDLIVKSGDISFQNTDLAAACRMLRGHGTETLSITYTRGSDETGIVSVTQSLLRLPSIETAEDLSSRLAYMKINGLYPDAGRDIAESIRGWSEEGVYGVILDLRDANGSDEAGAIQIANLLAHEGEMLFTFRDQSDNELKVEKASDTDPLSMPFMVLIDDATSGASELLAAILNGSVRGAMLIGQPTSGDPLIRDYINVQTNEILYIAAKRLVTADGAVYAGTNRISPDILVEANAGGQDGDYEPGEATERRVTLDEEIRDRALRDRMRGDGPLRRAVDILLGLKALNIRGFGITTGKQP